MKTFDVQSIAIEKPADTVFEFVADPANLPKWTNAFKSADGQSAMLETPRRRHSHQTQNCRTARHRNRRLEDVLSGRHGRNRLFADHTGW